MLDFMHWDPKQSKRIPRDSVVIRPLHRESGVVFLWHHMDEEPMEPCDARPDELVVAQTIERLKQLTPRLVPGSVSRKWAGLQR